MKSSRNRMFFGMAAVGAVALVGCAVEGPSSDDVSFKEQKSQCGSTWDGEGVEQLSGDLLVSASFVNQHSPAVGRIGGCSGTLLEADLFLTAAHCFDDGDPPSSVRFNYQRAPNGSLRYHDTYPVLGQVEHSNGGIDYAIVRLGGNPGQDYAPAKIASGDPASGTTIAIIGHPSLRPKEVATGHVLSYSGSRIRYNDLDTLGGNSGSGVFNANNGEVIAVHTNGGCTASGGANSGRRISRILDVSPTLRELLASGGGAGGPGQGDCAPGEAEYDNHCYHLTAGAQSFDAARASCDSRGSTWGLAVVEDAAENAFLSELNGGAETWLGATDAENEGSFRWLTGELFWSGGVNGGAVGGAFENFVSGEPNNVNNSDCLRMLADGSWRDIACAGSFRALCESDQSQLPPPPEPSCDDGIQNGSETDIDCGGDCAQCGDGGGCGSDSDCQSGDCSQNQCVAPPPEPTCNDGTRNGNETDVDCGGSCRPCSDGLSCEQDSDCSSRSCSGGNCEPAGGGGGGDVSASIAIRNVWESGYCADVNINNDSSSDISGWQLVVDLDGATLGGAWNATVDPSGGTFAASNVAWNGALGAGQSLNAFGFCTETSGAPGTPTVVSIDAN